MLYRVLLSEGSTPFLYIQGTTDEAERLFGGRFPPLPAGDVAAEGQVVYHVQHHPRLQPLAQDYLTSLLRDLCAGGLRPGSPPVSEDTEKRYASLLERTLVNCLLQDRRIGLVNLFWLSHSKELAETVSLIVGRSPELGRARFGIHPLLARLLDGAWRGACREVDRRKSGQLRFAMGDSLRSSLVDTIIDTQLPLAFTNVAEIDFRTLLQNNSRYRISPEVFWEIYQLLLEEVERRVTAEEPLLMSKLAHHLPSMERESYGLPAQQVKMVFNKDIRRHLLADHWGLGARLTALPKLRSEASLGSPLSIIETFDDLATAVQRFEILSRVRERILLIPSVMTEAQIQESHGSVRVYRFAESVEMVGNAVNAAILFLDLRGFTETSEGLISERDLTRELYALFDPFIDVVSRFGGEVDKFLGDGMMVTFGAVGSSREPPLDALRTAILLQEKIRHLREEGRTRFRMGVSIHYGRVYLAHFIGSSGGPDTTVIGRNVNLAGRLSSGSKRRKDDRVEETSPQHSVEVAPCRVEVYPDGTLLNEGIVVTRETLRALEEVLRLSRRQDLEDVYGQFHDPVIDRVVLLRYAGDAKFKGVLGSFPVYSVETCDG